MKKEDYRGDIDGLRGFAVFSVLLFHVGFETFRGGFVGVDLFFVISGFLITRLIHDEVLATNSFSFSNFYAKRARRLFPGLFFTLCLSFVFAFLLFAPQHLMRFGGALVHAVTSIANFYFWNESGYFNTDAQFKPLLHTWSLSVEEQFYMVWPLLIVFLLRKGPRFTPQIVIVLVGLFSFFLNFVFADGQSAVLTRLAPEVAGWFSEGQSTIFYLAPFRVFEFTIGAIIVWVIRFQPRNRLLLEPLVLTGLALIAYPVFTYTDKMLFPSYNALLPCIGAALIIYGGTAQYSGRLLNNPIAVGMGLISYSLYLIHWPLIVFYKYWKIDALIPAEQFGICAFSFIGAVLMYRFVEKPFRRNAPSTKDCSPIAFMFVCSMLSLVLLVPSSSTWASNGWTWRFPKELIEQISYKPDRFDGYVWERHLELERNFLNNGKPKVLVIGDSMAADFVNVLAESAMIEKLDLTTIPIHNACQSFFMLSEDRYRKYFPDKTDFCKNEHRKIRESRLLEEADTVILASAWREWSIELIDENVDFLRNKGVRQVGVVAMKQLAMDGVKFIARYGLRSSTQSVHTAVNGETVNINRKLRELKSDFLLVNLMDVFCDDSGCKRLTEDGHLIIFDTAHLSPWGAKYIGQKSMGSEWMQALLSP